MFHLYDGYHFFGMHMIWWVFWVVFIMIMFGAYEPVRRKTDGKDRLGLQEKKPDAAKPSTPTAL